MFPKEVRNFTKIFGEEINRMYLSYTALQPVEQVPSTGEHCAGSRQCPHDSVHLYPKYPMPHSIHKTKENGLLLST